MVILSNHEVYFIIWHRL